MTVITQTRTCRKCGTDKAVSEFPKDSYNKKTNKYYPVNNCKACVREHNRARKGVQVKVTGPRPKPNQPVQSVYEILNTAYMSQWFSINPADAVMKNTLINIRNEVLGNRDSWHSREYYAAIHCGWKHGTDSAIGADAYTPNGRPVEIKVNWVSTQSDTTTLSGAGSFSDYSQERLDRLVKEDYMMAIPFFIDHRMIAVATFSAKYPTFMEKLQADFDKQSNAGTRRAPGFTFAQWKDAPDLNWVVLPTICELFKFQSKISPCLIEHMMKAMDTPNQAIKSEDPNLRL